MCIPIEGHHCVGMTVPIGYRSHIYSSGDQRCDGEMTEVVKPVWPLVRRRQVAPIRRSECSRSVLPGTVLPSPHKVAGIRETACRGVQVSTRWFCGSIQRDQAPTAFCLELTAQLIDAHRRLSTSAPTGSRDTSLEARVLVGPTWRSPRATVSDRATLIRPLTRSMSLHLSATSSPRRAPVSAARATAVASTGSRSLAVLINRFTWVGVGTFISIRSTFGGVERAVGATRSIPISPPDDMRLTGCSGTCGRSKGDTFVQPFPICSVDHFRLEIGQGHVTQ